MAITIKKVTTRRELERFIRFNYLLYKNNPYSVPDLFDDMLNTFNKKKNAAFEFCEADYFLAYREGKIVGRVAAIINHKANQTWNKKEVRFGWIDFIDDAEVSDALIRTVEEWGKERGMTHIQGPLGFTDFDAEGMLIEGFDQLSTMATIYNYPYYPQHLERMGFEKDADWVEYKIYIPDAIPDKHKRISDLIQRKYNLKVKKYTSAKKIAQDYGQAIFELMNEAYQPLYGYSALSQRQIDQYVKMYLPILDLRMVTLITDADDQLQDLINITHMTAKVKIVPTCMNDDNLSESEKEFCKRVSPNVSIAVLSKIWQMMIKGINELAIAPVQIDALEMILIRIAYSASLPTPFELLNDVKKKSKLVPSETIKAAPSVLSTSSAETAAADSISAAENKTTFNTVEDLINKSEDEMMKVRNLGRKSLEEVMAKLDSLGFTLTKDDE